MKILNHHEIHQVAGGRFELEGLLLGVTVLNLVLGIYNYYRVEGIKPDIDNLVLFAIYHEVQLGDLPGYNEVTKLTYEQALERFNKLFQ